MSGRLRRGLALAGGLAGALLRPGRLSTVVLFVTDRCNARCPDCLNVRLPHLSGGRSPARGTPLSAGEYAAIAGRLSPLFQVIFSGGEPFLREDLDEIAAAFYELAGARLFSLPTNGSLPERALLTLDRLARRCPDAAVNLVVSLDAAGEKHDELRGLPGLFAAAMSLCRGVLALKARRPNVSLVVGTTLFERNLELVPRLLAVLREALPASGWHHSLQYDQRLSSRLGRDAGLRRRARELELAAAPRSGLWERLVSRWYVRAVNALIVRQLERDRAAYRCAAGRKIAVIMPDGETSPCEPFVFEERYRDLPRFNIRDHGWDYARLRGEPAFDRVVRRIGEGACGGCAWSCAAAASTAFDARNWRRLFS